MRTRIPVLAACAATLLIASPALAQEHQHHTATPGAWSMMQDGVIYAMFNRQGGPRGDREFVVPNWWMGMASRDVGRHRITFSGMLSLDAATVGKSGYAEIFQIGETLDDEPLVDRQHPHDLFMQLTAAWRISLGQSRALTVEGGPAGEATLGPVAFMHRASSSALPLAPLGHHTFDSTHLSFGVVAASLALGKVTLEASVFNGREADEHRWDFDLGRMDSVAARFWVRPAAGWDLQVSTGRLRDPEVLEPGDVQRTTASVSWSRVGQSDVAGVTAGWGVNAAHGARRHGFFAEASSERGANQLAVRLELQDLEVGKLLGHHDDGTAARVVALSLGAGRRVVTWRGFEGAIAAQATLHRTPDVLKASHGSAPVSAQVYFRLRLPAGPGGHASRMWGHTVGRGH